MITKISILGSGWLGLPLAKNLSRCYKINVSTRTKSKKESLKEKNINTFLVDIDTLDTSIHEFLRSDVLIINIPSKNIYGFKNLVKYIVNSSIKRIIFISSTSVCNNEKSPLKIIEKLFKNISIKTTILRFGGLFGKQRNPANFFKNGRSIKNPTAPVNMIHQDDCINIINEIIKQDVFDETFNCCSSSHPTKKEFYTYCAISSGLEIPKFDAEDITFLSSIITSDKLISRLNYKFLHDNLMDCKFI